MPWRLDVKPGEVLEETVIKSNEQSACSFEHARKPNQDSFQTILDSTWLRHTDPSLNSNLFTAALELLSAAVTNKI